MSMIEAVIFDIGHVLVEWHPVKFYDTVIGEARRREMFAAVDLDGMNRQIDLGAPHRETVYACADAHPAFAPEIRMWHDRWIEMLQPEIPHSGKLLRALRRNGIPVHALSNFGIETLARAELDFPQLAEFDRRYVSGHLGMMKPDAEIYAHVEADLGLLPETLLFADDRSENIEAAAARGWSTHLFLDPAGWAERLVEEGLLSETEARP